MADRQERTWSFVALLVGGTLIVVGALMGSIMMSTWTWMGMAPMAGMMGGSMPGGWTTMMAWWMGTIGVATGGLVLFAAYQIQRSSDVRLWGIVAIVAGALSLFAMGGWVVGAIAAMAGGALALANEGPRTVRPREA